MLVFFIDKPLTHARWSPCLPARLHSSLHVVVEVVVIAEDHLVRRVLVLGEGVVLAQEAEGRRHCAVLVLEWELALVGVAGDGGDDDVSTLGWGWGWGWG